MLPQEETTETIHEAPPVSDWSLWGLRFLVQPAKQVKPGFPFCLLKKCWEKKVFVEFFVSGLQAVLQALDSGHSVTALVKEFFPPLLFFFTSSLHYFIFATPLRCAVQTSWPISPTLLSLWQNATFSGFTFFSPFFPFPLCQNLIWNLSQEQLSSHLGGHDAVLSCLGFKPQKPAVTWVQLYKKPSHVLT